MYTKTDKWQAHIQSMRVAPTQAILESYARLQNIAKVATEFNISRQRVYQLLKGAGVDTHRHVTVGQCKICGRQARGNLQLCKACYGFLRNNPTGEVKHTRYGLLPMITQCGVCGISTPRGLRVKGLCHRCYRNKLNWDTGYGTRYFKEHKERIRVLRRKSYRKNNPLKTCAKCHKRKVTNNWFTYCQACRSKFAYAGGRANYYKLRSKHYVYSAY